MTALGIVHMHQTEAAHEYAASLTEKPITDPDVTEMAALMNWYRDMNGGQALRDLFDLKGHDWRETVRTIRKEKAATEAAAGTKRER